MTNTSATHPRPTTRIKRLAAAVALAGTAAVATTATVGALQSSPSTADSVTVVEAQPATYEDLRYAAEWARRLEILNPDAFPPEGTHATHDDLMRAAVYAPRSAE